MLTRLVIPPVLVALTVTGSTMALATPSVTPSAATSPARLAFVDCPPDAKPTGVRCAELTVPLDWRTPTDGRTTTIALRVVPSPRQRGGFTFNPGGPGSSGIEAGPEIYRKLPREVRNRFDFVMWDPRGVGASGPRLRGCGPQPLPRLPETGPVDWEATWSAYHAAQARATRACFDANPDAAPYLGTWQVVRDLDAMREALGYRDWNYWGMSYGTRIAYSYAKTFPHRLRALIVDGSVWPQESVYRIASQQPTAWFTGMQVYASIMGHAQAHKVNRVLEALDDRVVTLDGVPYTRWTVAAVAYGSLSSQDAYPRIRTLIDGLHHALFDEPIRPQATTRAMRQLEKSAGKDAAGSYANTFIHCADMHDRPAAQDAARLATNAADNYGTALGFATLFSLTCAGLPADYAPAVPRGSAPITLPHSPVVVLSTGDVRTPWIWGRTMANQYAGSRTLSYIGTQHVTYLRTPSTCVNDRVTRYLLTTQLPRQDLACPYTPSAGAGQSARATH